MDDNDMRYANVSESLKGETEYSYKADHQNT